MKSDFRFPMPHIDVGAAVRLYQQELPVQRQSRQRQSRK